MPSPSPTRRAADFEKAARFDNFAGLRNGLKQIAADRGDWAGIPMPLEGHRLIINPKFQDAALLGEIGQKPPEPDEPGLKLRNQFYSGERRCDVLIWEKDGKIEWGLNAAFHHFQHDLLTMGASVVWGVEQEHNALQLLATLLKPHAFKYYLMTGMFLEKSDRSGLTYMFRRLKPTVVIDSREGESMRYEIGETEARHRKDDMPRIICCLCMHPIAYYEGSWAGAMCPSDDVIAHLMMMRGDEAMFWRRSNQHPPYRPEAGL